MSTRPFQHPHVTDEAQAALHAAGWSLGENAVSTAAGIRCIVEGANGESVICAEAPSFAEAWQQAVNQARSIGMLGVR